MEARVMSRYVKAIDCQHHYRTGEERVVYVANRGIPQALKALKIGQKFKVNYSIQSRTFNGWWKLADGEAAIRVATDGIVRLDQVTEVLPMETTETQGEESMNEWTFGISSVSQINFELIAKSLTYSKPIALVDATPVRCEAPEMFAVVHMSVYEKATRCKGGLYSKLEELMDNCVTLDTAVIIKLKDPQDKRRLVDLITKVKQAPYKKKWKYNAEVTVVLPKVG